MKYCVLYSRKVGGRTYVVKRGTHGETLLDINGTGTTQSVGGRGPTGLYYDDMARVVPDDARNVLVLGLGCGTVARRIVESHLGRTDSGLSPFIAGVEIDPEILDIGHRFFELDRWVDAIIPGDARRVIGELQPGLYDAVIVDCYADATKRVELDARHLVKPGGMYIENVYDHTRKTNEIRCERR